MGDEPRPADPSIDAGSEESPPAADTTTAPATNDRPWRRWARRVVLAVVAVIAAALVAGLTVDLGPALKAQAERGGRALVNRPVHIGRLSVRLFRGQYVIDDLVIEGPTPKDRPFLHAGRIAVSMGWRSLLRREIVLDAIEMTDWRMVVETFADGRHTFPRFARREAARRRLVTTTLRRVRAYRGEFTFEDHGAPWSTVARNLDITVTKSDEYRGRATFEGGTVKIGTNVPMRAGMASTFVILGSKVHFDRLDLVTDGARSEVNGDVDLGRWPEQFWNVRSRVDFARMRRIFFSRERFELSGEADFDGTFHIFRNGRELKGDFKSDVAGLNAYRFTDLRGSLVWLRDRFVVEEARCGFSGGEARFGYSMMGLGRPVPAAATFDVTHTDVDLAALTDFLELRALRLAGRADGSHVLQWPLGRFRRRRGQGQLVVTAPGDAPFLGRGLPPGLAAREGPLGPEIGPFDRRPATGYVPIGGSLAYRLDPEWIEIDPSWMATPTTHVEFRGRTAFGERTRLPFHVTSASWQESDRLLAAIMSAFGSNTRAVPIAGVGEFDGVMLGAFARPRIEGRFEGSGMWAWGVRWGDATGDVDIENGYVDVTGGLVRHEASEIHADGRFALGYPRRDGGDEIDARLRVVGRPVVDLRQAIGIDKYPVDGRLSGEFRLHGKYGTPLGSGTVVIENAAAYGEPFERATANVAFEGQGIRFSSVEMSKAGGRVTGAAFVGFDGTYSFNADGRRIPVESLASLTYPEARLSGLLEFSANGTATFDSPRYDVRARVNDLFVRDEGIGQVTGRLGVRGEVLNLELEAASPRLAVSGSGRIALTPQADAELTFRFVDTSLDPYIRAFRPALSPFTTAVASGTVRAIGELGDPEHLAVEATVEQLDLRLFDYGVRNEGPIALEFDRRVARIVRMRLVGEDTRLDLFGDIDLGNQRGHVRATGDANLGLLQGLFRDIRSSGAAELVGEVTGPLDRPVLSGIASITNGRIRHFALPHSIEAISGRISFDAGGVRMDDLVGRLGGGPVRFGGRIGISGLSVGELALTATGEGMRLRYPEGVRSVVDADLALRGSPSAPLLTGTVTVRDAEWTRSVTSSADLFGRGEGEAPAAVAAPGSTAFPVRFDIRIVVPSTLRVQDRTARIVSRADLMLRGTYERPLLYGRADIERGDVLFEGNRYIVSRGSIDFTNPTRIEPFFDIEAETRVRVPGQIYQVVLRVAGTSDRLSLDLSSDPPLPEVEILSLLFGDPRDPRDAELRALQSPDTAEQALIQSRAARLLASAISSDVTRAVERTLGVDSVLITPSLGDLTSHEAARLQPTARLTIGKRISDRVFLTFSRSLSASSRDQIILLEYDQSDRVSWILSQNEDKTYALDVRVRRVF